MGRLTRASVLLTICLCSIEAKAPPGYVKPPEVPDKHPPRYNYGYNIQDGHGQLQGKSETRDGIYAQGGYFIQGANANQNVQYYADDWGYHPLVKYGTAGPHSKSRAHFAVGEEAVKALNNQENPVQNRIEPQLTLQSQPILTFASHVPQQPIVFPQAVPQYLQYQQVYQLEPQPPQQVQTQFTKQPVQNVQILEQNSLTPPKAEPLIGTTASTLNFGDRLVQSTTPTFIENKLIETTKNLVSGEDVLNINEAATKEFVTEQIATSTSSTYETKEALVTKLDIRSNTEPVSTIEPPTDYPSFLQEPIVVQDVDNSIKSTTLETIETKTDNVAASQTVVVTPRPVSTTFLAPITAGVQLQSIETASGTVTKQDEAHHKKVLVEIQKSLPYYLGKFEYVQNPESYSGDYVLKQHSKDTVMENLELTNTLFHLPGSYLQLPNAGQAPRFADENKIDVVPDQKIEQQQESQVLVQPHAEKLVAQKIVELVPLQNEVVPVQGRNNPEVEDEELPIPIQVPQSIQYPVEKSVVPTLQILQQQHHAYEVQRPFEVPYPYHALNHPYPIEIPLQFTNQQFYEPQQQFLFQQHFKYVPQPQFYQQKPQYQVVPQQKPLFVPKMQNPYNYASNHIRNYLPPKKEYSVVKQYLPPPVKAVPKPLNNGYLPPKNSQDCNNVQDQGRSHSFRNYYTIKPEEYMGLSPPKRPLGGTVTFPSNSRRYRTARSHFNDNNLRLEYGFLPPLIPSQEIDEHGNPIEKSDS